VLRIGVTFQEVSPVFPVRNVAKDASTAASVNATRRRP
jgi:hypothetical protein